MKTFLYIVQVERYMNIVIAGAGEIGSNLAIRLTAEGHNVSIIEKDPEATLPHGEIRCLVGFGIARWATRTTLRSNEDEFPKADICCLRPLWKPDILIPRKGGSLYGVRNY